MEFRGFKKVERTKPNKCKIVEKRKADGSVTREIVGECSPSQLKALTSMNGGSDEEEI